jgi:hypothetical protein
VNVIANFNKVQYPLNYNTIFKFAIVFCERKWPHMGPKEAELWRGERNSSLRARMAINSSQGTPINKKKIITEYC